MFTFIKNKWLRRKNNNKDINKQLYGVGLRPGDKQYRAYVGPPADYDLVAAMTYNLLTTLGLRQHHKVLDIGCGSLRVGRLLIPYLNVGNYAGIEPNKWLVEKGIQHEIGHDQIRIKKPSFYFDTSFSKIPKSNKYDFIFAQSIFSHCGPDLVESWLTQISEHLSNTGVFVGTFLVGDDCQNSGWLYPGCVTYSLQTMDSFSQNAGLNFSLLDWKHPRQLWGCYTKQDVGSMWFHQKTLTWNNYLEQVTAEYKM